MKCLLIIPAYNEAENIEKVVNNIVQNYPEYDYIIVNDSKDECVEYVHHVIQSEHSRASRSEELIQDIRTEFKELRKG